MTRFADVSLCDEMTGDYRQAQARADAAVRSLGDEAGAPRWLDGERLCDYRRRLLEPLKQHSPAWRSVENIPASEDLLRLAEGQIYADAAQEARHPSHVPPGTLLERIEIDRTGRKITRFHGDPEVALAPFKFPPRIVVGIGRP